MNNPDDIVGHKTLATGERDADGFPRFRHEPLTRAEANAIRQAAEAARIKRAETMFDDRAALLALHEAHTRLKELGWREAIYCPKDGTHFQVIEAGSTGIHDCVYIGEWPTGSWAICEDGDMCPSHPILFRLYP